MAYTLADMAQALGDYEQGVVKVIFDDMAGGYQNLLKVIPIGDVDSITNTFLTMEDEGPSTGIGSRPINGAYPEGTSSLRQRGFTVGNVGGRAMVDEAFMLQKGYAKGAAPMDLQIMSKSRQLNRKVNDGIMNGDRATAPNFFNGIKKWLLSANTVQATTFGSYTNGLRVGGTSVAAADQKAYIEAVEYLLRQVGGRDHPNVYIIANDDVQRTYTKAVRELGWFGVNEEYYNKNVDSIGGVKFLNPGAKNPTKTFSAANNTTNAVLPSNVTYGSSSTCADIYAVRFGLDDGVSLRQLRPLKVTELGRLQQAPVYVTEIDWYVGLYAANDYCIAKLSGVQPN